MDWRFLRIGKLATALTDSADLEAFRKALRVGHSLAFKPYQVSAGIKLLTWLAAAAAIAGLVDLAWSAESYPVSLGRVLAVVALIAVAAWAGKLVLCRLLRNPNPLWQILLAVPLVVLGAPLTWISTRLLDPLYLRSGPNYRQ